uniref:Uncharacterized protein n=1 Tax=Ciona intestinalis TaxID=7719 RepID=H2XUL7_CIOIN
MFCSATMSLNCANCSFIFLPLWSEQTHSVLIYFKYTGVLAAFKIMHLKTWFFSIFFKVLISLYNIYTKYLNVSPMHICQVNCF